MLSPSWRVNNVLVPPLPESGLHVAHSADQVSWHLQMIISQSLYIQVTADALRLINHNVITESSEIHITATLVSLFRRVFMFLRTYADMNCMIIL